MIFTLHNKPSQDGVIAGAYMWAEKEKSKDFTFLHLFSAWLHDMMEVNASCRHWWKCNQMLGGKKKIMCFHLYNLSSCTSSSLKHLGASFSFLCFAFTLLAFVASPGKVDLVGDYWYRCTPLKELILPSAPRHGNIMPRAAESASDPSPRLTEGICNSAVAYWRSHRAPAGDKAGWGRVPWRATLAPPGWNKPVECNCLSSAVF